MPYLGRELTSGNYLKLDDISSQFNGSTTTFQLKSGGSDFFPGSSFSLLVSVAGVIQEADSAYQINNNEITFATAPGASDDAFIIVLGLALGVGVPADGSALTGVSAAEVYGFTGIGSNLQVRTTNKGADNITGAQYDAFEQVMFAPSGISFSINNDGNLIATI